MSGDDRLDPPPTSPGGAAPTATLRVFADGFVWTDAAPRDALRLLTPALVKIGQLTQEDRR